AIVTYRVSGFGCRASGERQRVNVFTRIPMPETRYSVPSRLLLIPHHLRGRLIELVILLTRDVLHQLLHDRVALDALGLGVEVGDDAVPQHRQRDLADVLRAHVIAALEQCTRFAGEDEVLAGARPSAPGDVVFDEVGNHAAGLALARQPAELQR